MNALAYLAFQKFRMLLHRHCLNVKRNKMEGISFNSTHKSGRKCVIKKLRKPEEYKLRKRLIFTNQKSTKSICRLTIRVL
jgi:hypothetical protein